MKPYTPSNKVPSAAFRTLILYSTLSGLVVGGLTFALSRLFYLVLIFPAGMGLAGGVAIAAAIKAGKVRNPSIGTTFGALTGFLIYGTLFGGEYLTFKQEFSQAISQEFGTIGNAEKDLILDGYLQEKTGATGMLGYVKYMAKQGVSIGKVGQEGFRLDENFTWGYWLLEFAIVEGIIIAMAYGAATQPFCENCEQWYGNEERIGNVSDRQTESFLTYVEKEDNFFKAGELVDPFSTIYAPSLEVKSQHCPGCQNSDFILNVSRASLDTKGNLQFNKCLQGMISPRQHSQLLKAQAEKFYSKPELSELEKKQLLLAQQERSSIDESDAIAPHGLNNNEEAKLAQQLADYREVKEAYLVRKVVQYVPEKPFYILAFVRKRAFIESEIAEQQLLNRLASGLQLPGQILIISLNRDKQLGQSIRQTAVTPIYRR